METTSPTERNGRAGPAAEATIDFHLGERLRNANRRAIDFIEAQPLACVVGALAAGFLVGRVLREKR